MQTERAEEIIMSSDITEVFYQDNPVWIKAVDKEKAMAEIHVYGSGDELKVPVAELYEAKQTE